MVTFLVSGIWHGANWTFVLWGLMHGFFQVVEKAVGQSKCKYNGLGKLLKILITLFIINLAWIFFRMPSLADAVGMIGRIFDFSLPMSVDIQSRHIFALIVLGVVILFVKDVLDEFAPSRIELFGNSNKFVRWCSYLAVILIILLTGVFDAGQFIYANF
jgi:hypothetical protein